MCRLRRLKAAACGLIVALLVSATMGLTITAAHAHGNLVDGSPGPGDALGTGGEQIALRFDELAENGRALIAVVDAADEPVPVGAAQTTANAEAVCASIAPLREGIYTLEYSVTSNDGDLIRGKYSFEITADGDPPDNDITATCSDLTLDPPGEAQTIDEMGTGAFPSWLLYLLGGLLVIALGLVVRRVIADRSIGVDEDSAEGQSHGHGGPDPKG